MKFDYLSQVAAGMEVRIEMEIFAMAVGVEGNNGIGKISHHVEITTETDIMFLPVIASILFKRLEVSTFLVLRKR